MAATDTTPKIQAQIARADFDNLQDTQIIEVRVQNLEPKAPLSKKGYVIIIDVSGSMDQENRLIRRTV